MPVVDAVCNTMESVNLVESPVEAGPATQTVWGAYCPLGSHCKKGNSCMCKKDSQESAKRFLINHLVSSPYHLCTEEEAVSFAETANIESWEEPVESVKRTRDEERYGWAASRKRQKTMPMPRPVFPVLPEILGGTGEDPADYRMVPLRNDRVLMSKQELKNISDSLRRAKGACDAAEKLCTKAARAFAEESDCVKQCKEVVDSFM